MTPKCACPFQISSPNAFFLQMFTNDLHPNNFALFIVFPISVNTALSLQFFKPKTIVLSPFLSHSIFCSSRKHGDTTFKMYPKSHHVSSPPLLPPWSPALLLPAWITAVNSWSPCFYFWPLQSMLKILPHFIWSESQSLTVATRLCILHSSATSTSSPPSLPFAHSAPVTMAFLL